MIVLDCIADHVASLSGTILKIGIDGVDGVGKTTFGDLLADGLRARGREVVRSSADGFHNPREVRYRLGKSSPEGFYRDSYNYSLLQNVLLDPLSSGGSRRFRTAAFDHQNDCAIEMDECTASEGAILIFDGLFLHRPELCKCWDFSVFLDASFETTIPRGASRGSNFGSPDPLASSNRRYVDGNKIYFDECIPRKFATVVVDYSDLENVNIIRWNKSS